MAPSPLLTVMINAARKGARAIRRDFGEVETLQVSLKGPANFVTKADKRAEQVIRDELAKARPTYGFLMEESGETKGTDGQHRWVVDPIDGTTNFIHGIPHFGISIGLERAGEPVAGVIYNPIVDELFAAEKGRGAFLNDRRLRVAGRKSLADSVIACGIPHLGRGDHVRFRAELTRVQSKAAGIRRFGAASLDLAWVAAGRIDGYWERGLKPWDICAGIVLIREAGGTVGDPDGSADPMTTGDVLASNGELFGQIRAELTAGTAEAARAAS
ncbi:MAG: inositol monophosphatase family protein [Hyphomicrobiales bacterium]